MGKQPFVVIQGGLAANRRIADQLGSVRQ